MKRFESHLLSASAALLLAALALAGCGNHAYDAFLDRPGEAVCVIVTYDAQNKPVVSNEVISLREGKDWAEWASPKGRVYVTFEGDSPFAEEPKHEKDVLKSKPSKKGLAGRTFKYTVELRPTEGNPVQVDPRIEILP